MVVGADLIKVSHSALFFVMRRPQDSRKLGDFIGYAMLFSAVFNSVLTLMLIPSINGDIDLLARIIEAMTTWAQMFIKVVPLIIQGDRYQYLYEKHLTFWNIKDFSNDLQAKTDQVFKAAYRVIYTYRFLVYGTCMLFYLQPLVMPDELLIACYVPKSIPYAFEMLLFSQYIYAFIFGSFMVGIDSLYLVYCAHLVVQMTIINHTIQKLDITHRNFLHDFKVLVEYHKFLLTYATEMLNFWSVPLLGQYFISIYLSCMELYMFVENLHNIARIMVSLAFCAVLYCQFGLYCFPTAFFISEAENLAVAIYDSKWYEGPMAMQKNVGFVMMRAQKPFKFYAAGIAEINLEAFIFVFKASVSFFTVMRQMKEEKEA